MRLIRIFLFVLPSILISGTQSAVAKSTVLVCYGRLNPEDIKGYSYVILESQFYNIYELRKIKSQNEKVIAYISIGEVNKYAPHYEELKDHTAGRNEIWDSYYLDLKSEKTVEKLKEIISNTLDKGYDGMFLDNVDNYTSFGAQPGQKEDLVKLLKNFRETYPDHLFLQNAGLELIGQTAPYVNAVVIESIASNYTFDDKSYKLRDMKEFGTYAEKLKSIKKMYNLPVILIEYADTQKLHDDIERRIKPLRFEYFIGNIDLQGMPQFTK